MREFNTTKRVIAVFGTARDHDKALLAKANQVGQLIARAGGAVLCGGGDGVMGAVADGAVKAGGEAYGFNIKLPFEQFARPSLTDYVEFETFGERLEAFARTADAFIVMGGGYGTVLELYFMVQLMQVGHIKRKPIILTEEWLLDTTLTLDESLLIKGFISHDDFGLVGFDFNLASAVSTAMGE